MGTANVEIVRRSNAAFNRGDIEEAFSAFDDAVEWRDLQHAPDTPEVVYGVDAVRGIMADWLAAFDVLHADVSEWIDAGDAVVCVTHWWAEGKASGMAIDINTAEVMELRDGKIVRITLGYADKAAALAAVGLPVDAG
jgi:ketosteroid isomerase-like protein